MSLAWTAGSYVGAPTDVDRQLTFGCHFATWIQRGVAHYATIEPDGTRVSGQRDERREPPGACRAGGSIMNITEFLVILGITLAAELTDKSMVAAVLLSRRNGAAKTVSAAVTAVGIEAFAVAFLANSIRLLLHGSLIHIVTGIALTGIGIFLIIKAFRDEEEDPEEGQRSSTWPKIFLIFFLAELGDVTQATTAGFALATGSPIFVGLAATLGMGISLTAAVALTRYTQHLSQRLLYCLAGIIILVLAGLSFAGIGM